MRRALAALAALGLVAACTAQAVWAPDDVVARARYVHQGPPEIALITVINNRSDEGAHSALLISGSERVLFDPAGSWWSPAAPERNDLHFGITPAIWDQYVDYHTRVTFRTVIQRVTVPPEVAEQAIALAKTKGPVSQAFCADATSDILRQLPGFEGVSRSLYPRRVMDSFERLPGVRTEVVYDDDDDNNRPLLAEQVAAAGG